MHTFCMPKVFGLPDTVVSFDNIDKKCRIKIHNRTFGMIIEKKQSSCTKHKLLNYVLIFFSFTISYFKIEFSVSKHLNAKKMYDLERRDKWFYLWKTSKIKINIALQCSTSKLLFSCNRNHMKTKKANCITLKIAIVMKITLQLNRLNQFFWQRYGSFFSLLICTQTFKFAKDVKQTEH